MAKKRKKKLTYWQRVYLTLKIRTKRALKNFLYNLSHYKVPMRVKLILGSIVLLICLFYGGKFALHSYRISTQTKYGYTKEEAQLILDTKSQAITKEYGYSEAFIEALKNQKYDENYKPLYFYTQNINSTTKLYYDKLLAKQYSQEELKIIFETLSQQDIVPLLIYDKQEDLELFFKDTKNGKLSEDYLKPYENVTINTTISIDSLINKKNGLDKSFVPENLTNISNYCAFNPGKLTAEATTAFNSMCMDAKEEKIYFASMTAYRTYSEQEERYKNYASQYGNLQVDDYTSRPGYDEHQSGLAVNISSMANNPSGTTFTQTAEYTWLSEHAAEYGFIFRYPGNKQHLTGMSSEPSHLRYVGVELAQTLKEQDLTLEEFHALYK